MLTKPNGNGSNFHSSGLRQKVDRMMDILWSGGVNNPMDSIEQISYLLFLRLLTEKDEVLATLDKKYKRIFSGKWARFIDHLADGGRAGVIVPNGVLFGSNNAVKAVRELLLTACDLQAVIGMPSGVFKPYSGVGTAALIFEKGRATESVWFYDLTADGFSLDDKRTPIAANDIPDVRTKWPAREEGPNSYRVPIEKIKENDWSLAGGRYKQVTAEAASHNTPAEILAEVLELESGITQRGNALLARFGEKQ